MNAIFESELQRLELEDQVLQQLQIFIRNNKEFESFEEFFDEKLLRGFARGKKYDVQKACDCLQNYLRARTQKYVHFFKTLKPHDLTGLLNSGTLRVLKHPDKLGRAVVIDRAHLWDPSEYSMDQAQQLFIIFLDEAIRNSENATRNGIVTIWEMSGYNLFRARQFTFTAIGQALDLMMHRVPISYKGIHYVNEMPLFGLVFKIIKLLLSAKLRQRNHFHATNLESLHAHVSPEILPKYLGGNLSEEEAYDTELEERIKTLGEYYTRFAEKLEKFKEGVS